LALVIRDENQKQTHDITPKVTSYMFKQRWKTFIITSSPDDAGDVTSSYDDVTSRDINSRVVGVYNDVTDVNCWSISVCSPGHTGVVWHMLSSAQ